MGAVHTAAKRSPRSRDGTTITRSGGRMAAVTPRTIGCCSTRPATAKSITPAVQRVYRTLSQGCFERLEPDIRKLICPVLRGGGDGNAASLPDTTSPVWAHEAGKASPLPEPAPARPTPTLCGVKGTMGEVQDVRIGNANGPCAPAPWGAPHRRRRGHGAGELGCVVEAGSRARGHGIVEARTLDETVAWERWRVAAPRGRSIMAAEKVAGICPPAPRSPSPGPAARLAGRQPVARWHGGGWSR